MATPSFVLSLLHCSGFSGTPSDLLPRELRPCMVEPGSDAAMVRLLSSAHYVSHTLVQDWTVDSLLSWVATHDPPFHALIDRGALVRHWVLVAPCFRQSGLCRGLSTWWCFRLNNAGLGCPFVCIHRMFAASVHCGFFLLGSSHVRMCR